MAMTQEPHFVHRAHASEFRAFIIPSEWCAYDVRLLVSTLKGEGYVGTSKDCVVHVPFATTTVKDRGGEPRQVRVCETLEVHPHTYPEL